MSEEYTKEYLLHQPGFLEKPRDQTGSFKKNVKRNNLNHRLCISQAKVIKNFAVHISSTQK